jgi:hypothetical protein
LGELSNLLAVCFTIRSQLGSVDLGGFVTGVWAPWFIIYDGIAVLLSQMSKILLRF